MQVTINLASHSIQFPQKCDVSWECKNLSTQGDEYQQEERTDWSSDIVR